MSKNCDRIIQQNDWKYLKNAITEAKVTLKSTNFPSQKWKNSPAKRISGISKEEKKT